MKIKIIQVLQGKEGNNSLVYFQIGNYFYCEKFDYSIIDSAKNVGFISPQTNEFNLFVANNLEFKNALFEVFQKLTKKNYIHFPINVSLEWEDFVLRKSELQTA